MQVNVGPFDIEAASDAAHGIFQEQKVSLLLRVGRFKNFLKFVFGWDLSLLVVFRERGNLCCWIDGYEAFLDSMVKYGLCGCPYMVKRSRFSLSFEACENFLDVFRCDGVGRYIKKRNEVAVYDPAGDFFPGFSVVNLEIS